MTFKLRQPGIFGQLCWDTYTVVILGFAEQPGSSREKVMASLDSSALRLLSVYPFLAGQVVKRGKTSTNSGTYEIIPYPPHDNKSPVRRKDCDELLPSYEDIQKADAPFSMLDGDILSPMKGMGYQYDENTELPVFIVQANFVKGGLLLCFASMHNALDMNGQGILMKMFATAARGEEFDAALIAAGNQDANTIVPLLQPGEEGLTHENMRRPSTLSITRGTSSPVPRPEPAPWNYWRFSPDALAELKKIASSGRSWVSTNDAITAFFMQRLTALRVAAGRLAPEEDIHCFRAVDGRRMLRPPVHEGYLGHLVAISETTWNTAQDLVESLLADVALDIRESLKTVDDHHIRSLATLIHSTEDKTTIFYGVNKKARRDLLVSSWTQLQWLSECSFGPDVGSPDFVRRARLSDLPDLVYLMPKNRKGEMALAVSLFHEDFVDLLNDPKWREYAQLIG
jgi:hypothetical protein